MNILMCLSRMTIGGAETHVLTLASALVRKGHTVLVASSGGPLAEKLGEAGISHVLLPLDKKDPVSLLKSAAGLRMAAKEISADIVHAHGRIPSFVCGLLKKAGSFPPVVTTAHGYWDPSPPKGPLSYWGEHTIAVSGRLKTWLQNEYGIPGERITVIENGIMPERIRKSPAAPGTVRITALCRLDADNSAAIRLLCKAAAELGAEEASGDCRGPKPVLTVYGDGTERKELEAFADGLSKPGGTNFKIKFAGPVTSAKKAFEGTDIFAGSSRSAIEAAAAGLPVILLSGSGVCGGILSETTAAEALENNLIPGEVIGSGKRSPGKSNGISGMNGSLKLLTACIGLLAGNTELAGEAAGFSRSFAAENFDIDKTCDTTLSVYGRVLERTKRRILLCGYFGASNAGDDASLKAVVGKLGASGIHAERISVISRRKGFKAAEELGIKPVPRLGPASILREIGKSRLFVLCGGSLLQDTTSRRSLAYYFHVMKAAAARGCRTMLWGQGLGPIKRRNSEKKVHELLLITDAAGFRDADSLEYARRTAGDERRAVGKPDFYLSADAALDMSAAFLRNENSAGNGYFVIIPKKSSRRDERVFTRAFSAAAARSAGRGVRPVAAALHPGDAPAAKRIAAACGGRLINCE
ncbi:MAG: glycosyltransferase, partial [Clostridia bacterium]|nr:glycosyltransferase [Clostridia bacterium]